MTESNAILSLKDYQAPDYKIAHVDLEIDIRDGETFVTSTLQVERNGTHNRPLRLDGVNLELLQVSVDGFELGGNGYKKNDESLTLDVPENCLVKTRVRIKPEENTALEGLYKSGPIYCTQCEATGFRRITYFIDRPDNMATYTTKIIADKKIAPVLLSNGNKIQDGDLPDGRFFTLWSDPFPKPSYLFAVVAGALDVLEDNFTTQSGRNVALRIWAEKQDLNKLNHAMECLKASMKWDEDVYGREYDLDLFNIVAVSYFNMGAMENKSLNIFNTKYVLANSMTQTDSDFDGVDSVIAHEYFHNWTGNRVTCRDWFQLTLKEGLTVFRDQEYSASRGSRAIARINNVRGLRAAQFPEDSGPLAHPIRLQTAESVDNFYTSTIYQKGAEVIRMMHTLLGEDGYRAGTDLYFDRHDGQAVTCNDFVAAMADATGRDLSQFMLWYDQAGTPIVTASWAHDSQTNQLTLTLSQETPATPGQPIKKPMVIPVKFGLVGPDGSNVLLDQDGTTTATLELTQPRQSFVFDAVPAGSVPSILRHFSAPVRLDANYSDSNLRHLMMYDSDGFNRWEAGQRYLREKMLAQIARVSSGKKLIVDTDVIDTFRTLLQQKDADYQLLAEMLTLPGRTDLEEAQDKIDPLAVKKVKSAFMRKIATSLRDDLIDVYKRNCDVGQDYCRDQNILGRRALMNMALSYLAHTPDRADFKRIQQHYDKSSHMTDQMAALRAMMANKVATKTDQARTLDEFYSEFKDESLVIDKWFSLQASIADRNVTNTIKALRDHPDFDIKNPNRVRSLYSAFAYLNASGFHAKDGSGYKLVADFISEIDPLNSQIASGLVESLTDFAKFKEPHHSLMKAALRDIASTLGDNASTSLKEKLGKSGVLTAPSLPPATTPENPIP